MVKNKMADVVDAIVNPKLPINVYIDVDPIAYAGACSAEKAAYQWFEKDTDLPVSEQFTKAQAAKDWFQEWEFCGNGDPDLLERRTTTIFKEEQDAFDACDEVMKDYLATAKKFTRNDEFSVTGYMTPSGSDKIKDCGGLENRYQFNRFECTETWTPKPRPKYLKACRNYLLRTYDWIKMAATGFEADTHVIALSERYRDGGLILSIDKDLDQCENTWYVNMNLPLSQREAHFATPLGDLWEKFNAKGDLTIKGNGFKWLCFQAVAGDASDGYKGLNGTGQVKLFSVLSPCTTKQECMKEIKKLYDKKLEKGFVPKAAKDLGAKPEKGFIKYLSWDGKKRKLDALALMQQHFFLAYQERGPSDDFNVEYYLINKGE